MRLALLLALLSLTACSSSSDESTALTIEGTVVDGQGAPIAGAMGQACVIGRYVESPVGEGYEITSCGRMTTDASGQFLTKIVLGPQLREVKSSFLAPTQGSCQLPGVVPSPVEIREGDGIRVATMVARYVVLAPGCL